MLRGTGFGKDFRFQTNISPRLFSLSELAGLSVRNDITLGKNISMNFRGCFGKLPSCILKFPQFKT